MHTYTLLLSRFASFQFSYFIIINKLFTLYLLYIYTERYTNVYNRMVMNNDVYLNVYILFPFRTSES